MKKAYAVYLIAFTMVLVACRREFENPSWEMNINAPLIYSDMGIEDLIPDSLLAVNADNSINLVFDQKLFSYGIDSVLDLADSTIKDSFLAIFNTYAAPGSTIFTNIDNNDLNVHGPELTRMQLKQGFIDYTVNSNVADTIILEYSITTGTILGAPLVLQVTIPPAVMPLSSTVSGSFSLANADLDLTGIMHNQVNAYQTKLVVKTAPGLEGVSIVSLSSKVKFEAHFRSMLPSYVQGYFGNISESSGLESQTFDFFKNLHDATLDLAQVNAQMYISNGLGADARIIIDTVMALNSNSGTEVMLTHPVIGQSVNINRATNLGYAAQPYVHTIDINSGNSNIESFLELLPDQLKYKLGVELNPLGNISAHTDFLYENSKVEAGLRVDIPLNLMASNLNLSDTVDFDLDKYDQSGKILRGKIKINVANGLPLQAVLTIAMLDENDLLIGTLAGPLTIPGNGLSSPFSTGVTNYNTVYADLNDSNIGTAYRAKKIIIRAQFQTTPSGSFVNIYNTQRFKTQISVKADYLTQE